ncbi:MAG: hypothetical protein ABSC72_07975 [Methylovirgula sp.]
MTVLEPKGNAGAEVAVPQNASKTQILVYGGLAAVSGFLTSPLGDALNALITPLGLNIELTRAMTLSALLAGLAFAIALVCGLAYHLRFRLRQLVIIPFVLTGWFLAVQTCDVLDVNMPGQDAQTVELAAQCASQQRLTPNQIHCLQVRASQAEARADSVQRYWKSIGGWAAAGAIGALLTGVGVPIAAARRFSFVSLLATISIGAAVAILWFAIIDFANPSNSDSWIGYALYVPWQAGVAVIIGRSIR